MAYMFNDDKSKNDVTEKPLIISIEKVIKFSQEEVGNILSGPISVPSGYTAVGITNAIMVTGNSMVDLCNIKIQTSLFTEEDENEIKVIFDTKYSSNAIVSDNEYYLVYSILFVRSEFANIELPTARSKYTNYTSYEDFVFHGDSA